MPVPSKRLIVALLLVAASGCGHSHVVVDPPPRRVDVVVGVTSTTLDARAVAKFVTATNVQKVKDAAALIAVAEAVETVKRQGKTRAAAALRHSSAVSASSGGCFSQPYVPAWIITRESHGDPTIINGGGHAASPYASGGRSWGCFQFMPGTWDANCRGLSFDVSGQIECARRVSSNGTNLRPWAL